MAAAPADLNTGRQLEMVEWPAFVMGQVVLEIGSGCGVCGLLAMQLGAQQVVLTDVEGPVLRNLQHNDQQLAVAHSRHPEQAALAGLGGPLGAQPHTAVSSPDATFGPALLDPSTFYAHDLLRMSDAVTLTGPLPPALHPDRRFPRIIGTDVM
ncbi:uncharacterized protein HaLaN_28319, partial [Haematococcus lacustris]